MVLSSEKFPTEQHLLLLRLKSSSTPRSVVIITHASSSTILVYLDNSEIKNQPCKTDSIGKVGSSPVKAFLLCYCDCQRMRDEENLLFELRPSHSSGDLCERSSQQPAVSSVLSLWFGFYREIVFGIFPAHTLTSESHVSHTPNPGQEKIAFEDDPKVS